MLPQEYRLKKRSAFQATYKTGQAFHYNGLTMFCGKLKKNDLPIKIGFVVSKKTHKRAVRRNRIKRLMRENFRILLKEKNISSKYMSAIFVASPRLLDKDFFYIKDCVYKLAEKL